MRWLSLWRAWWLSQTEHLSELPAAVFAVAARGDADALRALAGIMDVCRAVATAEARRVVSCCGAFSEFVFVRRKDRGLSVTAVVCSVFCVASSAMSTLL